MSNFAISLESIVSKDIELSSQPLLESCVYGISKNQDIAFHGREKTEELGEYEWGVVLDGHGSNHFINDMRKINWTNIMRAADPWTELECILLAADYERGYERSGSTLVMMRAFKDRIETVSIGDSLVLIHKNGEVAYKNTAHNMENPTEVARLQAMEPGSWSVQRMTHPVCHIRTSNSIQTRPNEYIFFGRNTQIAMTQSIGHNNITGYAPERNVVYYTKEDCVQCILASDGFSDMILLEGELPKTPEYTAEEMIDVEKDKHDLLTMSATELVEKAEARWRQTWNYMWTSTDYTQTMLTSFPEYDDVSVILWKK
jgi:serine/threonine protein phosphatase PrpC